MPLFQYKAINTAGARLKGVIEGDSSAAAMTLLLKKGLHATELRETAEEHGAAAALSGAARGGRISALEMALFLRQLATLVNSDVPLVQSLTILERQTTSRRLQEIVITVREDVQGGRDFSHALGRFPKVFPPLVCSMVRVGETGGVLGPILAQLADITERDEQMRSEVRAAMIYPIIVVIVGVLVVGLLMTFVVPRLAEVFGDMGSALPTPTKMLMAISLAVKRFWWAAVILIGATVGVVRTWRATEDGRLQYDRFVLRVPKLGDLARKASISRFARALGVLLGGGVPLLESLQVVKGVLDNAALGKAIESASSGLREGGSLARELEQEGMFPPLVIHMIGVGETSGNLDSMLIKIAETYEWQTQQAVKVMVSVLAPVTILCLAVVVGFIALAMLLPLFSMNQLIR